jgi:hypothetical protein
MFTVEIKLRWVSFFSKDIRMPIGKAFSILQSRIDTKANTPISSSVATIIGRARGGRAHWWCLFFSISRSF